MLTNDFDYQTRMTAHCPLLIDLETATGKYNSHYDRERKEWVKDD